MPERGIISQALLWLIHLLKKEEVCKMCSITSPVSEGKTCSLKYQPISVIAEPFQLSCCSHTNWGSLMISKPFSTASFQETALSAHNFWIHSLIFGSNNMHPVNSVIQYYCRSSFFSHYVLLPTKSTAVDSGDFTHSRSTKPVHWGS